MTRSIQITCLVFLIACFGAVSLCFPKIGAAQSESTSTYLTIINVDRSAPPVVELTLSGGNAESIQSAALEVLEDGVSQTILQDRVGEGALYLALMIDPRALDVLGASGQPRYLEITGVILKLLEDSPVVGSEDRIATFVAEQNGGIGTIQAWTEESDLIFSTFIQQRANIIMDENSLIHDSLLYSVDKFKAADESTDAVKSILLFSAGIDNDGVSTAALDQLVKQLRAAQIQVHVAHFGQQDQPAALDQSLQRLSKETNGHFLFIDSEADFKSLIQRIADSHTQRFVSYESTQTEPNEISVQLTLADGTTLVNRLNGDGAMIEESATNAADTAAAADAIAAPDATDSNVPTENSGESAAGTDVVLENAGSVDVGTSNSITIPGTELSVSRNIIMAALAAMLALLVYFLFADFRSQNAYKNKLATVMASDGPHQHPPSTEHNYLRTQSSAMRAGQETTKSDSPRRAQAVDTQPREQQISTAQPSSPAQVVSAQSSPAIESSSDSQINARTIAAPVYQSHNQATLDVPTIGFGDRSDSWDQLQNLDDAITEVYLEGQFDEGVLAPDTLSRPMLGYLVRVTEEKRLPLQLPIYQLATDGDQRRHIHIGRNGQRNTVVINSPIVSREHAVLVQKEGRLYLRDNGSTAGTYLNWRKLQSGEELLIRNNDLIGFGEISYEFRVHGEDEVTVVEE